MLCCPFLPVDHLGFASETFFLVLRADHPHRHLSFKQHGVPLRPFLGRDHGSRSPRLLQVLSHVSMSALRRCASFKPFSCLFFFIFPTRPPPPKQACPLWVVFHKFPDLITSMESERDSFLPAAAGCCLFLLNFSLSVGALPTSLSSPCSRRDQTRLQQLSSHQFSCSFAGRPDFFLISENLISHFFLLVFSFARSCFSFSGPRPTIQHLSRNFFLTAVLNLSHRYLQEVIALPFPISLLQ